MSQPTTLSHALLCLAISLVIATAVITHQNTIERKQALKAVTHRYTAIHSSRELLALVTDMETGEHGYVISLDSEFLQPYNQAKSLLDIQTDSLRNLHAESDESNILAGKILQAVDIKCKEMDQVITIASTLGKETASAIVNSKVGKAQMDTLRTLVQELSQRELNLLSKENRELDRRMRLEDDVRFAGLGLIVLTVLIALVVLIQRRRKIQTLIRSLEISNVELERKVKDRTKELVSANEAKDHFLGIASHDLKVPLVGIQRLIALMKTETTKPSATSLEYLGHIEETCVYMQRLLSNLLDINRIDRNENHIQKSSCDLNALFTKLRLTFTPQATKKGIHLTIDEFEKTIMTDAAALSRIMDNLVSNAIKFCSTEDTIRVEARPKEDTVVIDVIDDGPGISTEEIPKLFTRFARHSNQPTDGEGSTGLGLSIVHELVRSLGGKIEVRSKLNDGSTFSIILPVA
jgi:signal transduction histidine kinase